jgi:hypothetical protein
MPKLFGIDIAGIVAKEIGPGLVAATIHRQTWGDRDSADLGAGLSITEDDITCKGVLTFYDIKEIDGTLVEENDRLVIIIVGTMSEEVEPHPTWGITIEDRRYTVISVRRDPAAATYSLQVRAT